MSLARLIGGGSSLYSAAPIRCHCCQWSGNISVGRDSAPEYSNKAGWQQSYIVLLFSLVIPLGIHVSFADGCRLIHGGLPLI